MHNCETHFQVPFHIHGAVWAEVIHGKKVPQEFRLITSVVVFDKTKQATNVEPKLYHIALASSFFTVITC